MNPQARSAPTTFPESRVRRAHERGALETDWLQARFSFSFGDYVDPNHTHWGSLRALNEDLVSPGRGFARHGHRDIEALTYPLEGRIHHTDSLGNDHVFGRGELLHMSAGDGITHTEMNASATEPERHLQIWLYPRVRGTPAACELVSIDDTGKADRWRAIASPDGRDGSATIGQDALVFASTLSPGARLDYELGARRLGYLHVVAGEIRVEPGLVLRSGDGLRFTHGELLSIESDSPATELLLFDL